MTGEADIVLGVMAADIDEITRQVLWYREQIANVTDPDDESHLRLHYAQVLEARVAARAAAASAANTVAVAARITEHIDDEGG